jgi:hypothetical protein
VLPFVIEVIGIKFTDGTLVIIPKNPDNGEAAPKFFIFIVYGSTTPIVNLSLISGTGGEQTLI